MQTQFKLSPSEIQAALQVYVAKANRSRNLHVSGFETKLNAEGAIEAIVVEAEVVAAPSKPRAPRQAKAEKTKKQA